MKTRNRLPKGTRLGILVKILRTDLGMTRSELGAKINRSASTVGQIERGEIHNPPQQVMSAIYRALRISEQAFSEVIA